MGTLGPIVGTPFVGGSPAGFVFVESTGLQSLRKSNLTATTNPTVTSDSNAGYGVGSYWLNTTTGRYYICRNATVGAAIWLPVINTDMADRTALGPAGVITDTPLHWDITANASPTVYQATSLTDPTKTLHGMYSALELNPTGTIASTLGTPSAGWFSTRSKAGNSQILDTTIVGAFGEAMHLGSGNATYFVGGQFQAFALSGSPMTRASGARIQAGGANITRGLDISAIRTAAFGGPPVAGECSGISVNIINTWAITSGTDNSTGFSSTIQQTGASNATGLSRGFYSRITGAPISGGKSVGVDYYAEFRTTDANFGYHLWFNGSAVYAVSTGGKVEHHNPGIAKFVEDSANYERCASFWDTNVYKFGPEAGGTGILRPLQLLGAHVVVGGGSAAGELRILEPSGDGTHYVSLISPTRAADLKLTLPSGTPSAGQFLRAASVSGSDVTLDFQTISGGGDALTANPLSQFAATTSAQLDSVLSDNTGAGGLAVFNNGPTLVAPVLGAATATSINKVVLTAPATGSTLTIADGKTLTVNNNLTLTATDGAILTIGGGGTLGSAAYTSSAAYATAGHNHDGTYSFVGHAHSGGDITSGTVAAARLGSGSGGSTKFLREDSTWQVPPGGGDAVTSGNLDQFADVTQTAGKTLAITENTTLGGGNHSGTNTGNVTLAGTLDYLTIVGQELTRGAIDLGTDVTGDLPLANLAQASAASVLLGRGSAAGAGDWQELTLGANLSMSGTVLSATGGGGSQTVIPGLCQHRLSLESGVYFSTTDQTAKTTVYLVPTTGNLISLYSGSAWNYSVLPEIAITIGTKTSGKHYDIFAFTSAATPSSTDTGTDTLTFGSATGWETGAVVRTAATGGGLTAGTDYWYRAASGTTGTLHATLAGAIANTGKVDLTASITAELTAISMEWASAWTSDTARADAIVQQSGAWVKSGATTRLYLGMIRTTSTTQTEFSDAKRFCWSHHNRLPLKCYRTESASHTVNNTPVREWNNGTNVRAEFIIGLADQAVSWSVSARATSSSGNPSVFIYARLDTTHYAWAAFAPQGNNWYTNLTPSANANPGIGYHYFSITEAEFASVQATLDYGFVIGRIYG